MTAVWYRLRAETRSALRLFLTLALLAGLAGGGVLAALDGARRTDANKTVARLQKEFAIGQVNAFRPMRPTDVENYRGVQPVPLLLAALLGLTALGALTNTLVSSVRGRRRDFALLKTLGFLRRQVRSAIAWQATILTGIALLFGLPLGVAVGRWAWRLYAVQQGVVPEPVFPFILLASLALAMLLLANVVAAFPARLAAATPPGLVSRSE